MRLAKFLATIVGAVLLGGALASVAGNLTGRGPGVMHELVFGGALAGLGLGLLVMGATAGTRR